jgi:hypothetical protein
MEPITIPARADTGSMLTRRCRACQELHLNRIALGDNPSLLLR